MTDYLAEADYYDQLQRERDQTDQAEQLRHAAAYRSMLQYLWDHGPDDTRRMIDILAQRRQVPPFHPSAE